jgi:starvation-inducible DNA-binding protein
MALLNQLLADGIDLAADQAGAGIDESGDADTADILTAYSRALDKALWFLEAHTQEPAS